MSVDFDLSEAQHRRCAEVLAAVASWPPPPEGARDEPFTRVEWKAAAEAGLTGLCVPEEHGGLGLGALDTALCLEAFGRGCPDTGLVFAVAAHLLACVVPIRDFGRDEVRGDLLAALASGELIAANAMTEDGAGSDLGGIATTAVRSRDGNHGDGDLGDGDHGDHYVVDGQKSFASNAPQADVLVTYAVTDPRAGFLGVTALAVRRELPGVEVGEPLAKMGLHGCPAGRVTFRRCRVPASAVLGEEGQGAAIFQHSMTWERSCLFAAYLGLMERQLEQCVERARTRRQFGRPIGDFQAVSHRIAVMRQRLDGARLLLYRACWQLDRGRDRPGDVAMAKAAVSEAAVANSVDAVQIFGGDGYLAGPAGPGIERQLRDAVPTTIFSGTTEIQRELVAREMGL